VAGEPPPALFAEAVDLQPLAEVPPGTLAPLAARLSRFVELPVHVLPTPAFEPKRIPNRGQLDAASLLELVEARGAGRPRLLVGVAWEDIAVPLFTFVFGLARQGGHACVVSFARTDPAFYGLPEDVELRDARLVAEILHELGHLATLQHCTDRSCVMSFAGSIERADTRGSRFCPDCAGRLPRWLRGPGRTPGTS
jgi:archaemetzincin